MFFLCTVDTYTYSLDSYVLDLLYVSNSAKSSVDQDDYYCLVIIVLVFMNPGVSFSSGGFGVGICLVYMEIDLRKLENI